MEHSHKKVLNSGRALRLGIAINIVFVLVETFYGFTSNSTALLADAGHNFGDVLAMGFSLFAIRLSQRKPTLKFTYGLRRSTILVALLNTIILLAAVALIFFETIGRLSNPLEINAKSVIIVATIGIVVNGFTAWLFVNGEKHDLNIRSTFLHFLADALVSMGVVAAGIIIALTGFYPVDSIISFIIIAAIFYSSYHLLIDSLNLALDAVPENVSIEEVSSYLRSLPEVISLHDLHVWALGTTDAALTVHLATNTQTDIAFLTSIQRVLAEQYSIEHATIQVEYDLLDIGCETSCN